MVVLFWKDERIDLTKFVDWRTVVVNETADETLNTAKFEISLVKGHLQGLDFSRPLPRLALVEINLDGVKQFLIETDNVIDNKTGYKHEVSLISVAKLLMDTTNAGLTVTQPHSNIALYYRSMNVKLEEFFVLSEWEKIDLLMTENSIDTGELDGMTIKKNKHYTITVRAKLINKSKSDFIADFKLRINGIDETDRSIMIPKKEGIFAWSENRIVPFAFSFEYENTGINEVELWTKRRTDNFLDGHFISDIKVAINTTSDEVDETIYLDYVVEKLLKNDMNKQRFFLDETSKGLLSEIRSYEWTLPESYLWLQLTRIAEKEKLFPTARMEKSYKYFDTVSLGNSANANEYVYDYSQFAVPSRFVAVLKNILETKAVKVGDIIRLVRAVPLRYFFFRVIKKTQSSAVVVSLTPYDELLTEQEPSGIDTEHKTATIDDYAAKLEINAENVYSEQTAITEVTTLRASGETAQITVSDIIVPTKFGIGEVLGFKVRLPLSVTVGGETFNEGTWVEIDNERILPKQYYDTLPSEAEYNLIGRQQLMKNNTLYYEMGKANIYGLEYHGGSAKKVIGVDEIIRAIYEVVLTTLSVQKNSNEKNHTFDRGKLEDDNKIVVEITYRPHKRTSASIYKSDQSGFEFTTSKFLNETAILNSPDIIASYTQSMADRSGGTILDYSGITDATTDILTKWGDKLLFSKTTWKVSDTQFGFSYQYIKDFVFHSSYESYNKKERLDETPRESVVNRVSKKNTLIVFDTVEKLGDDVPIKVHDFVEHLGGYKVNNIPKLALLEHSSENDISSLLPVSVESYGKTLEFLIEMKDNYSAGLTKYTMTVGDDLLTYQKDHRYTNVFGRVENVKIELYKDFGEMDVIDLQELPKAPSGINKQPTGLVYKTDYNERKDARERSIYSLQVSYLSGNNAIIIYDGITKFGNFVNKELNETINCGKFSEMPSRTATEVDLSKKLADIAIDITDENYIEFWGAGNYVIYDRNDQELLLAVEFKTAGVNKLYFRGENE